MGKKVKSTHQDYGLTEKNVSVTVTDNGANIKKSFREFGCEESGPYITNNLDETEVSDEFIDL